MTAFFLIIIFSKAKGRPTPTFVPGARLYAVILSLNIRSRKRVCMYLMKKGAPISRGANSFLGYYLFHMYCFMLNF
jgi:hypothetical protein